MRKNAESMRYAGLRCAIACAALTIGVIADAYRLFRWDPEANRGPIVTSEQAVHWPESRFPLRFRTLENEHLPTDIEITQQSWTELVERALQRWTDIPTSNAVLILEGPAVATDRIDTQDGINTIGFWSRTGHVVSNPARGRSEIGRSTTARATTSSPGLTAAVKRPDVQDSATALHLL